MSEIKHTIVVEGGPISGDMLMAAIELARARAVGRITPPETAMQRAERMLQSEAARMLAAETAKPMSDAPTMYGKQITGAVVDEWNPSKPRVEWPSPSLFAKLLPVQSPDIGPAEPIAKCDTMPESKALADQQWNTSEWLIGKPNTTYMIDGIPMAAATVQRSDLLHGALAKVEASARDVPVEAREGARISDVAGIAAAEKEEQADPLIGRVLAAPRVERKPGVKEAITGLTTAASGDHRFGRWGAVE